MARTLLGRPRRPGRTGPDVHAPVHIPVSRIPVTGVPVNRVPVTGVPAAGGE
ncbi:hypothetical protein ACIQRS_05600 [Streptomyces termitum]|uniref:Uncharacterized protein n=1 Tax=Streptomyces termitum TaxID=67368 RepID=A0A918T0F6_9ACTN|nr:hypothetical protein [Streptomyces termitum]GHA76764.1 hypothetical protein GCM10010305_19470 [Streptomyces termitum]